MERVKKSRLEKARERLMERLPFEMICKIGKYRNFNMEQYLQLIDKLEGIGLLLLESYVFNQRDTS
jgi:hypothetical protein